MSRLQFTFRDYRRDPCDTHCLIIESKDTVMEFFRRNVTIGLPFRDDFVFKEAHF